MLYYFFKDKKRGSVVSVDEQLAEELRKPVAKRFKRRKVYARFKEIFGQQIQLKWNYCLQRMKMLYIYYVSQVFSLNMRGGKPLKGKTVLNYFIEIVNESNRKLNKLWVDQGRNFTINLCKNGQTIMIF